ncbi:MAG: SAM-dependent DNA methyltransferase [Acidimicrobiales bacterium]|nr:SAM-dependent DNA methyltransferase [Acidimicrobiales bacterium]MYD32463.1 SAM-dependent DNA methyltransferase [Acidimicrobiales bacterium]MYI09966.1 SAM-dependent DNA methyltransferase [Acidimicrobiales bacterium]
MPAEDSKALVQRLWDFCDVLRDDGLSYGDYLEQLTYLLFLKMADEQYVMLGGERIVPVEHDWQSLLSRSGADLEAHYSECLSVLGSGEDMLGVVFRKARNRIQTPAKLEQLIKEFIDQHEWMSCDADLKGDAYEGLIEKTAQEGARGAGQYFTPRALIDAIVDVMAPEPGQRICDPACGTGGFFLGAYRSIMDRYKHLEPDWVEHLRSGAFIGWEIADLPARLCAMNMLLHGIESPESDSPIKVDDALRVAPGQPFDMVLTNPPFGRSSSDSYEREDLWATTRNKQLNFVQHVVSLLRIGGDAAVVVPDNVLFEAGAGETIRRRLLADCEVHTLLRLPTGIFYAQGVKANVLFFRRREGAEDPWTREMWVYDLRTNKHFTLKQNPLTRADLDEFVACYRADARHKRTESERFKRYAYDELIARDKVSLDLFWLRDESLEDAHSLPPPSVLAAEIAEDLEAALAEIQALADSLAASAKPD